MWKQTRFLLQKGFLFQLSSLNEDCTCRLSIFFSYHIMGHQNSSHAIKSVSRSFSFVSMSRETPPLSTEITSRSQVTHTALAVTICVTSDTPTCNINQLSQISDNRGISGNELCYTRRATHIRHRANIAVQLIVFLFSLTTRMLCMLSPLK